MADIPVLAGKACGPDDVPTSLSGLKVTSVVSLPLPTDAVQWSR